MATNVKAQFGRTLKITVNQQGKVIRNYAQSWRLSMDSQPSDIKDVSDAFSSLTGIEEFEPRAGDTQALCRSINVTEEMRRNPWTFIVAVEWNNDTPAPDQKDREHDNPLDDPIEIESDDEILTFPLFEDRDDKMISNTAGDPLAGLEGEESVEIIRATRNEATRDSARDRTYRHAVNSVAFSGAEPGTVKCRSIKASLQYRNGIEFYKYVYEFAWKRSGWQPKVLNAGLYQLDSAGDRVPCVDRYGEPVTAEVPLDDDGAQIDQADLPDAAVFKTFKTIPEVDFADLNLGI